MTLHCDVIPLWSLGERTKSEIAKSLCRPGSDFHKKMIARRGLDATDGTISLVFSEGRSKTILGWARSEPWVDGTGGLWPTLEAFVDPAHRRSGIAAFATAGLVVNVFAEEGYGCAVFSPAMLLVAARAGLHPTLFLKDDSGEWTIEH